MLNEEKTITISLDEYNRLLESQKQVDELTAFKNEAISMSLYVKGRKDGEEVAVKDTAKEILQSVGDIVDDGDDRFKYKDYQWHKDLCKRYGVEVE